MYFYLLSKGEKECLTSETCELKQKVRYLQDQLLPLTKQREYQEKEIQRLNRVSKAQSLIHIPSYLNEDWQRSIGKGTADEGALVEQQ